jgi:hypothetical protein
MQSFNTTQRSAQSTQHNTAQHNTTQHNVNIQYNAIFQYIAMQCNAMQSLFSIFQTLQVSRSHILNLSHALTRVEANLTHFSEC